MSSKTKNTATKAEAKQTLVPKLRFPEFQSAGEWKKVKLGSVATIRTEKVGNNVCIPMSITSGVGLVSQKEKFGRVIAGKSYKNYLLLRPDDFAYNKSATKEYPEGFLTLYSGTSLAAVPNSIFTCFCISGESPDVRFLNYQFSDNLHGRWLRKIIQVGARDHGSLSINDDDLMAVPVPIPAGATSVAEQKKIAECLISLDELITAQARKVDALKNQKRGLMQQLFPREGDNQPRVRLPGFRRSKPWTGRTISELLEKAIKPIAVVDNVIYREIGVRSHGKGIFHKSPLSGAEIGAKRVFRVIENALVLNIVFAWEQAVATTSIQESGMIASHRFPMYVPRQDCCDVRFVKLVFSTPTGKHLLEVASPGGAGRNRTLGKDEFEKLKIILPEKEEQTKIADRVLAIDELITSQTSRLEKLKMHKKGLMRQLFPSQGSVEL